MAAPDDSGRAVGQTGHGCHTSPSCARDRGTFILDSQVPSSKMHLKSYPGHLLLLPAPVPRSLVPAPSPAPCPLPLSSGSCPYSLLLAPYLLSLAPAPVPCPLPHPLLPAPILCSLPLPHPLLPAPCPYPLFPVPCSLPLAPGPLPSSPAQDAVFQGTEFILQCSSWTMDTCHLRESVSLAGSGLALTA